MIQALLLKKVMLPYFLTYNSKTIMLKFLSYYAPCPAEGRSPPKAVNGRGRAGCSYFTCTFISTYKVRIFYKLFNRLLHYIAASGYYVFWADYYMILLRVVTMYSGLITTSL